MIDHERTVTGRKFPALCAAAAGIGLLGCAAAFTVDRQHLLFAYLIAFMFTLTIVLGMLFFVLLHHLTDAGWSTVIRRPAEQFLVAIPVLAVLFIPILLGRDTLFGWTHGDDELYRIKSPFLNVPFFIARAVIYFAVWWWLAGFFRRGSLRQDDNGDERISLKMRARSAPGMILFALTLSFAAIDWLMTLDYHWFSTIFGVYVFAGSAAAAMAVLSIVTVILARGPLRDRVALDQVHDLGKWVFAFSCFWAYIAFSQFFLIWYANIPEETGWMMTRWHGPWKAVTIMLTVGRFVIPFIVLMPAAMKKTTHTLVAVSAIVIASHFVDMYWLAMPILHKDRLAPGAWWIDVSPVLLLLGVCGLVIHTAMRRAALYPLSDPRLDEVLATLSGHGRSEPAPER